MPHHGNAAGKVGAVTLWLGLLLFAVSTAVHPFEFDPSDPLPAIAEGPSGKWILDHWALSLATLLLGAGLAAVHARLCSARGPQAKNGFCCTIAALFAIASWALWLLLFSLEATFWPVLTEALHVAGVLDLSVAQAQMLPLYVVAAGVWRALLAIGYLAGAMFAVAVMAWGRASADSPMGPMWTRYTAFWGGMLAVAATPPAWFLPKIAPWLVLPGYGLLGIWMVAAGWNLWSKGKEGTFGEDSIQQG